MKKIYLVFGIAVFFWVVALCSYSIALLGIVLKWIVG